MDYSIIMENFYYENLFEQLSLIVEKNTITSVSGKNNCGKTTLIRILNREIIVDGEIDIEDFPINSYRVEEYAQLVESVIPLEKIPIEKTIEEEMFFLKDNSKEIDKAEKEEK